MCAREREMSSDEQHATEEEHGMCVRVYMCVGSMRKQVVRCFQKIDAVYCSVLWCVAVCCSVFQCVAVCCSLLQCVAVCCNVLQCVIVCCSVLRCVVVCCSVL